jgi:hypothetical protein
MCCLLRQRFVQLAKCVTSFNEMILIQVRVWDVLFTEGGTRSVFQLRVALALLKIFEPILLKKNSFEGIMEVFKIVLQSMWNSQSVRLHGCLFHSYSY